MTKAMWDLIPRQFRSTLEKILMANWATINAYAFGFARQRGNGFVMVRLKGNEYQLRYLDLSAIKEFVQSEIHLDPDFAQSMLKAVTEYDYESEICLIFDFMDAKEAERDRLTYWRVKYAAVAQTFGIIGFIHEYPTPEACYQRKIRQAASMN